MRRNIGVLIALKGFYGPVISKTLPDEDLRSNRVDAIHALYFRTEVMLFCASTVCLAILVLSSGADVCSWLSHGNCCIKLWMICGHGHQIEFNVVLGPIWLLLLDGLARVVSHRVPFSRTISHLQNDVVVDKLGRPRDGFLPPPPFLPPLFDVRLQFCALNN